MKDQLLMLADYHVWSFEILYCALLPVSDHQYVADCGLFFGSIHRTLNHLLLADRVWFGRFSGRTYPVAGLDMQLESARGGLERALYEQSQGWRSWIESQGRAVIGGMLEYRNVAGTSCSDPFAATLLHVFNHGTHHRGQISAAITGFRHAAPEMDLIYYLRSIGTPTSAP